MTSEASQQQTLFVFCGTLFCIDWRKNGVFYENVWRRTVSGSSEAVPNACWRGLWCWWISEKEEKPQHRRRTVGGSSQKIRRSWPRSWWRRQLQGRQAKWRPCEPWHQQRSWQTSALQPPQKNTSEIIMKQDRQNNTITIYEQSYISMVILRCLASLLFHSCFHNFLLVVFLACRVC